MKSYKKLLAIFIFFYISLSICGYHGIKSLEIKASSEYKVEINRLINEAFKTGEYKYPNLDGYEFIKEISFLDFKDLRNKFLVEKFYRSKNGLKIEVIPYYLGDNLLGYIRFDYGERDSYYSIMFLTQGILFVFAFLVFCILIYIGKFIIEPFNVLTNLPYELSKGHLDYEINESKNRYFGRFLWGISLLRDTLNNSKVKELKVQREKKLMILSISHDIRTPLNNIKLYGKALETNLYDDENRKKKIYSQIGKECDSIDNFIADIVKATKEEFLEIKVVDGEFYLKDLIDKINSYFKEKLAILSVDFSIGLYSNKLIKGDIDRSFEVIENVMENAVKYGNGVEISIEFYEEEYSQLIRIHNSGGKINENEFNHIFDSFFRGSNVGDKEGTGLGLYICREIMRKMNGEIFSEYDSDGMSFILVFRM